MSPLFKRYLTSTCMSSAIFVIAVGAAMANPQDGVVSAGSASISYNGSNTIINQTTQSAVIDWRSFDIGASEVTQFIQPSSSSITLNRVNSVNPSYIDGHLIANGNIFIVNQNGVLFGSRAVVDVNGLVASTADINNTNFMNGNFRFDQAGKSDAIIANNGLITAAEAGLVGLVAPNVLNSGVIHAKLGRIHLASGDRATVDLYGDGLIQIEADDPTSQRLVVNTGVLQAEGGTIALTAAAGANIVNSLIHVSGEVRAPSIGTRNGKIIISAEGVNAVKKNITADKSKKSGVSTVIVDGLLDVSGIDAGEIAGNIAITADHIAIMKTAMIDATGSVGGGTVHIGGELLGGGETPAAKYTIVQAGAFINASALDEGHGGEVVIYADGTTEFSGTIISDGAGESGNGGFAETSGKANLMALGTVQLRASRRGRAGTWLLDPADITITTTATNSTGNPNFTANGTGSQVTAASIVANLNAGTNVTITTSNDAHAGNGDIFVNSAITSTGSGSLTLSSYRNITVNSAITLNGGALTLRSDNAGIGIGGITVGQSITTNGGNITMGGGSGVISAGSGYAVGNVDTGINITASVNAGNGNILINGRAANTANSFSAGVNIDGVSGMVQTTGSGTITIYGLGGSGTGDRSRGIRTATSGGISSVSGNITLVGTGGGTGATSYGNLGVLLAGSGGVVSSGGNISIIGVAGGGSSTTASNVGVSVQYAITNTTGSIVINGTGTGSGAMSGNTGIDFTASAAVNTSAGNITITGIGGNNAGTGGMNHGISITVANAISTSGGGNIIISGTKGGQSTSHGIYNSALNGIKTTGSTGDVTVLADTIFLNQTNNIVSVGTLTLAPLTAVSMSVGASGGALNVSNTYLGYVSGNSYVFGSTSTAGLTINTTYDFANKNVTFMSGDDINIAGNFIKATGSGTASYELKAYRNIYNSSSSGISASQGSINILLQSDYNADNNGTIYLNGGSISSNGGNITMGGGSGIISAGSGFAYGNSLSNAGVYIANTVSAGTGNIIINGSAYTAAGANRMGVYVSGNISATGTGTITINGIGTGSANAGFNNIGVWVVNSGNVSTQNGLLTISGVDQTIGTGFSWGVYVSPGGTSTVRTTGTGDINITGNSRSGASSTSISTTIANGIRASGSGNIILRALSGTGVYATVTNAINTASGNITIYSDSYSIGASSAINAGGVLNINSYSNRGMSIGTNVASTTNIDSTSLSNTLAGTGYIFGSLLTGAGTANTSDITINTTRDFGARNVSFIAGGNINLAGNLTKATGVSSSNYLLQANGNISNSNLSGIIASTGSINLTINSDYDQATTLGGYVALNGGTFNTNGGNLTIGGGVSPLLGNAYNSSGDAVLISASAVLTTGAGNISIRGENAGSAAGTAVLIIGSITSSSGAVSIYGKSSANNSLARSILINGSSSSVSSASGNITFTGVNTSGNSGAYAFLIYNVATSGATINSTSGNIIIDTSRGSNESGFGIVTSNISTPAISSTNGNVTILTDSRYLSATATQISAANGTLTIAPKTNIAMAIGTSGGGLSLSNAELGLLAAANYIFGSTTAGDVTINTTRDFGLSNISFISGGNINLAGTITKASGASSSNYLFQANGNISNSGSAGISAASGNINVTMTSDNDVSGAGSINLTSSALAVNGGAIILNSNGQSVTQSGSIGGNETINSSNGAVSIGTLNGDTAGTRDLTINAGTATFTTTTVIGGTNRLNNFSVTADDVSLGGNINGSGVLTFQPTTVSRNVYINRGTADGTNFNLSNTELGYLVNGWSQINIGRTNGGGSLYLGTTSWNDPIIFRNNYRLDMAGALTGNDNASVTFDVGSSGWINSNTITTNGQNVSFIGLGILSGANNITTNGGNISARDVQISVAPTFSWLTSGGNITISGVVNNNPSVTSAAGKVGTFNAGAGNVSFSGTVNSELDLNVTGATITASSVWGASRQLGNTTFISTNSITLPTITLTSGKTLSVNVTGAGNSITTTGAIATGSGGNISLTADDVVLDGNLSGTGTLTLQPASISRAVRINSGTADFNLSTAELAYIFNGWNLVNIGRTDTNVYSYFGQMSVGNSVNFRSRSGRYIDGNITGAGASSLTFSDGWLILRSSATISTAGQLIDASGILLNAEGSGGINSNGGNVLLGSFQIRPTATTFTVNSGGGNISFASTMNENAGNTSGRGVVLNAGPGTVTFGNTVNGAYDLTVNAGSIIFGGAWGGNVSLGNVTLTSINSLLFPSLTTAAAKTVSLNVAGVGNSITTTGAIATGTGGNISLTADDVVLGGNLSGTGTLTLQPNSISRVTRINGGSGDFNLSTAEISYFQNGWNLINIGRTNSVVEQRIGTTTWADPIYFRSGYAHQIYGIVTTTDNATQTYQAATNGTNFLGGNINSDGAVAFNGYVWMNTTVNVATTNDNIIFGADTYVGPTLTVNAGSGSVSFVGEVKRSGNAGSNSLNASAGSFSFSSSLGRSSSYLDNVSLSSVNAINLPNIYAGNIFIRTTGVTSDIAIGAGKTLLASGIGDSLILVSGRNFINNTGTSTPLGITGAGRWLVYSTNPSGNTLNGMTSTFVRYGCAYGGGCPSGVNIPASGNGFIYTYQPTLTVTPTALATMTYGDTSPNLNGYAYNVSGYLTGAAGSDSAADTLGGSLIGSTSYTSTSNVGSYEINYSSGTLTSALGYLLNYINNPSAITVNKALLTVTANNQTINYGTNVPATTITYTGFLNGENSSVIDTAPIVLSNMTGKRNSGTYIGNYIVSGAIDNNYTFIYLNGDLTILPDANPLLTISASALSNIFTPATHGSSIIHSAQYNSSAVISPIVYILQDVSSSTVQGGTESLQQGDNQEAKVNNQTLFGNINSGFKQSLEIVITSDLAYSFDINGNDTLFNRNLKTVH